MPARRKKKTESKVTATAAPQAEEKHPTVKQVVEVVEEVQIEEPSIIEEPPVEEPQKPREEEASSTKSMVEELYTEEKPAHVMPEISMHKKDSKKSIIVWAIVTIIVALLTGTILYSISRNNGSMRTLFAAPTPTPTPEPTPTPTPTPAAVDKTSFKIKVLNGGGAPGAAGKMRTLLEDKGYTVSGTGNTEEYTYTTTEIHGKPTMTDAISNIKTDIKDSYTLGTVAADLDASSSADIEVIVGKE